MMAEAAIRARGWNRPVRPLMLAVVGGTVLLVWLALMSWAVWTFYQHWAARIALHHQPVRLRLPAGMVAMAEVDTPLRTQIDAQPHLRVPVKQTVVAEVSDQLQARVQLKTSLPISTTVTVDQMVPVQTTLRLTVKPRAWLPAVPVEVPVTLSLPLHMSVPVQTVVPLNLDMMVSGNLPRRIEVPVDQTFEVRPRVKARLAGRMLSQTAFSLVAPVEPFDLSIERADLVVPFDLTFLKQRTR